MQHHTGPEQDQTNYGIIKLIISTYRRVLVRPTFLIDIVHSLYQRTGQLSLHFCQLKTVQSRTQHYYATHYNTSPVLLVIREFYTYRKLETLCSIGHVDDCYYNFITSIKALDWSAIGYKALHNSQIIDISNK